jgi:uncharacterized tellurite resistance protein B-like protein
MIKILKSLLKRIQGSDSSDLRVLKTGESIDDGMLVAVIGLLIEISSVDDHIDPDESRLLVTLLDEHYSLPHDLVLKYVDSVTSKKNSTDQSFSKRLDDYVSVINEGYNDRQRELLLSLIWRIVLADEKIEDKERKLIVQMRYRFKLSEEAAERAKFLASTLNLNSG